MSWPFTLFEVSWETCNKVGGIHTVLSTKARSLVESLGDQYVVIGPALLDAPVEPEFEEEPGFDAFKEACRRNGTPVRVGRWLVPGRPRTILVAFSGLYEEKDDVLASMWTNFRVDSLFGGWDYLEPVLFGQAAARVIEMWWQEFLAPRRVPTVAQFHEWMTGSGVLYLKERVPSIATVFTTHATVLGRAIAGTGARPIEGLAGRSPEAAAKDHNVLAKHSMEGASAREADVFTTVSELTALEAEQLHDRRADPILPNGIDLAGMDEIAGGTSHDEAQSTLRDLAARFLGGQVADAALIGISGRYEMHNKGVDLFLDALALLNRRPGRRLIAFLALPAGNRGLRPEVAERLRAPLERIDGPAGISTHELFDPENDPVQTHCRAVGLTNGPEDRVRVIQIPIYLRPGDGLFDRRYEGMLRGMELTCFPSFYEPWGYTPEESLAAGVPTITSDCAGFGLWARELGLGAGDGLLVLERDGVDDREAAGRLALGIESLTAAPRERAARIEACRRSAAHFEWSDLIRHYRAAFERALEGVHLRLEVSGLPPVLPLAIESARPVPKSSEPRLRTFEVSATLPASLSPLTRLAANYWWSWNPDAQALFEELSPSEWESCGHNPYLLLRRVSERDLAARSADAQYLERVRRVVQRFESYLAAGQSSIDLSCGEHLSAANPVAYLCAEFAIHESLSIYSGGLGVLAGDHLKSASDRRVPLVAVGLFYRKGYLRQELDATGEQLALDEDNDPCDLPIELVRDAQGAALIVTLSLPSGTLQIQAWRVGVGRVTLYLLDTDLPENHPEDRVITHQLYAGGLEERLRQEIVLGRGGVRMLRAIGIEPAVLHLNEGHAAFAAVERAADHVRDAGLTFDEALALVRASTLFTTHTPVPAGHDRFGEDLIRRYFANADSLLRTTWEQFLDLGRAERDRAAFNMTYLATNLAGVINGVSRIHRRVTQELLGVAWPQLLADEVPVTHVTNGVHLATWTQPEVARLLGVDGRSVTPEDFARRAADLDPWHLWQVRVRARQRLVERMRVRIERDVVERGERPAVLHKMLDGLDDEALFVGFARRFAPYKRASLLFLDPERLAAIVDSQVRPVRVVLAGKAHPRDGVGREILSQVLALTRTEPFVGRVFFLEGYDLELARAMLQGCDVWLNTPIRRHEASGTSGMKAAANGALNLSVPDGWWPEAFDGTNGWSLSESRVYPVQQRQDELDAAVLHHLLRDEIAPLFYERDERGLPLGWIERVKHSLRTIPPRFNSDRMVTEYLERAYVPLADAHFLLSRADAAGARGLAADHRRLRQGFDGLTILGSHVGSHSGSLDGLDVGDEIVAQVDVDLGGLRPEDVVAEFVLRREGRDAPADGVTIGALKPAPRENGVTSFVGTYRAQRSGSFACGLRVRARARGHADAALRDLVVWA